MTLQQNQWQKFIIEKTVLTDFDAEKRKKEKKMKKNGKKVEINNIRNIISNYALKYIECKEGRLTLD